eukprot:scaffold150047_cov22-Tisochrysis_lutea.AAC.3
MHCTTRCARKRGWVCTQTSAGGSGFLGQHLVAQLLATGKYDVRVFDVRDNGTSAVPVTVGDLRKPEQLEARPMSNVINPAKDEWPAPWDWICIWSKDIAQVVAVMQASAPFSRGTNADGCRLCRWWWKQLSAWMSCCTVPQ